MGKVKLLLDVIEDIRSPAASLDAVAEALSRFEAPDAEADETKAPNGNRGVACGLGNIQKIRDGAPLGGKSTAADDFVTVDDDDFLA